MPLEEKYTTKKMGSQTSRTEFMQPSFSGLFVTWAYLPEFKKIENQRDLMAWKLERCGTVMLFLPQTTFPAGVTKPSSLTLTWYF